MKQASTSKIIDQGKEEVAKLCQYFTTNRQAFLARNEAQVRQWLIDPLFEALGWDVRNEAMTAPQYREVIPEDSLDVEGHQKAPDYTFRVGPLPKFYAEAKKCGANINADPAPAYQLRRYGWSARVVLSILTDFEELGTYDCTMRPHPSDKASHARIQYFRYDEYPDRWRELWDVFSREAVWSGAFDQYAASKRKRGTSEVDVEFLKEMEGWRLALAGNIALRNKDLSLEELNAAVQLTIDRVVFLRMAEDRGLEPYEQLLKLCERPDIFPRFMHDLCRRADEKYNSGLFHFQKESGVSEEPDRITPKLAVDDKVFKPILESLYFAHGSPYHFGVLPVEILGTVYERFLGNVIRLTAGHQAKVEEKPEVRKAGGVYYTPAHIVEYIVNHTIGRQIEGRSPAQLAGSKDRPPFRVLDMACGSGSFLLGAYQRLLDHALNWYIEHKPEKFNKAVYKDPRNGHWRLTIGEKKRILTTHMFGVDIDLQAVEVTKLSLLLKVLQGETDQSLSLSQLAFGDRALPNLADNIKCGNSLVAPDYFTGKLIPDPEEMKRVNPFDWKQGFPDATKAGGFDCIIGNPPWGQKDIDSYDAVKSYIRSHYDSAKGIFDLFRPFVEKAIRLTRPHGFWGMVLPDIVLLKDYPETRLFILDHVSLTHIDWWGMAFHGAVIDAATLIGERDHPAPAHKVHVVVREDDALVEHDLSQQGFRTNPRYAFNLHLTEEVSATLDALRDKPMLGEFFEIHEGIHSGNIRDQLFREFKVDESCREMIFGRDEIRPYLLEWKGKFVRLSAVPEKGSRKRYANVGRREWYEQDKILVRRTGDYILAAVDRTGRYASNNFFLVIPKSETSPPLDAVAAVLNSDFMTWFFRSIEPRKGRVFAEVKIKHLRTFPLPCPASRRAEYNELSELGKRRAKLAQESVKYKSADSMAPLRKQMDHLDREVEKVVLKALNVDEAYRQTAGRNEWEGDGHAAK